LSYNYLYLHSFPTRRSSDLVGRVIGLETLFMGELVDFSEVRAMTLNSERVISGLAVLGTDDAVMQADVAEKTGTELLIPETAKRSEEHTSELQSRGHLVCRL